MECKRIVLSPRLLNTFGNSTRIKQASAWRAIRSRADNLHSIQPIADNIRRFWEGRTNKPGPETWTNKNRSLRDPETMSKHNTHNAVCRGKFWGTNTNTSQREGTRRLLNWLGFLFRLIKLACKITTSGWRSPRCTPWLQVIYTYLRPVLRSSRKLRIFHAKTRSAEIGYHGECALHIVCDAKRAAVIEAKDVMAAYIQLFVSIFSTRMRICVKKSKS